MTEFLSDEWIEALDHQLRSAGAGSTRERLTVQYDVTTDDGIVTYHVVLGPDGDAAQRGPADDADIVFTMDADTARAVSTGELSSEEAFITGRLSLEGDTLRLLEAHRAADDA